MLLVGPPRPPPAQEGCNPSPECIRKLVICDGLIRNLPALIASERKRESLVEISVDLQVRGE
jgi:hypothetical protein